MQGKTLWARLLTVVTVSMCGASYARATPVGSAFTYQGRLNDGGSAANGQYDFYFRLYPGLTAIFPVGDPVILDNVQVTNGLFTVDLDFGAQFDGNERWLSISVRPGASTGSYTALSPRQEIKPSPYALSTESLNLPLSQSGDSDANLFLPTGLLSIYQTGTAAAILGTSNNSGAGLRGENSGTGDAVYAHSEGASNGGSAVHAVSDNYRAGNFEITSAGNDESALVASTAGSGHAAQIVTTNGNSTSSSLHVLNLGKGSSAHFARLSVDATEPVVLINGLGNAAGLEVLGTTRTSVLEITGGSDLSERFDVAADDVQPGMVLVIDADRPGQLKPSNCAYDRSVAGVVSGAGGVAPGMVMSQTGTAADGRYAVALTGRVYCLCDARDAEIKPGDLLTTSNTPGHAMRASDSAAAPGATLGKAMTGLAKGEMGLVLVLVNLQ